MKKILLLSLAIITLGVNGQIGTKIKYKQMENPATSSVNLGVQTLSAGNVTFSNVIANGTSTFTGNALFSSSVGIGALPNNALSSFRMVKGTSTMDIGAPFAGYAGIWLGNSTITTGNYFIASEGSNPFINAATTLAFGINSNTRFLMNTNNSYHSTPLRVGSSVAPSATLDVTGSMSVSASSTVNGYVFGNVGLSKSSNFEISGGTRIYLEVGGTAYFTQTANGTQIGNNSDPNAAAVLDLNSTSKGFLPPRMTTAQKNAIASPVAGLVVYDTTLNKLCVYTTAWETITSL